MRYYVGVANDFIPIYIKVLITHRLLDTDSLITAISKNDHGGEAGGQAGRRAGRQAVRQAGGRQAGRTKQPFSSCNNLQQAYGLWYCVQTCRLSVLGWNQLLATRSRATATS